MVTAARQFRSIMVSLSSMEMVSMEPIFPMPAQLISHRTSGSSSLSIPWISRTACRSVRSYASIFRGVSTTSCSSSSRYRRRATTQISSTSPARSSIRTNWRPSPLEAPVTTAIRRLFPPSSVISSCCVLSLFISSAILSPFCPAGERTAAGFFFVSPIISPREAGCNFPSAAQESADSEGEYSAT